MKLFERTAALACVLMLFVAVAPFTMAEDDFITVAPVEKKETGTLFEEANVEAKTAVQPTPAVKKNAAAAVSKASIERILTVDLKDAVEVRIFTTSAVKYKATDLAPPPSHRVLVQLSDCSVKNQTIPAGKGSVLRIRTAPHDTTAWVVVDLSEKQKWTIRQEGTRITLSIAKSNVVAAKNVPAKKEAEAPAAKVTPVNAAPMIYRIVDIASRDIKNKTRVIITTDGPVKYRLKKDAENKNLVINVIDAVSIWKKESLTADEGPFTKITASENSRDKMVDVRIDLTENVPYTVTRDQNQIVIDLEKRTQPGKKPRKQLNLSQKLSINVQDATVPGVLRLLSTQTGFEFTINPSVNNAKPVTTRQDDQTLDTILREILIPQGLFYEVRNNMIKVGTVGELKLERSMGKKLTRFYHPRTMTAENLKKLLDMQLTKNPIIDAALLVDNERGSNRIMIVAIEEDLAAIMDMIAAVDGRGNFEEDTDFEGGYKTKVFKLQYANPSEIQATIKELLSADGKIQLDERTGSLIVTDAVSFLKKAEAVIKKLDVRIPQVMIEAKLYEINVNAARNLGVRWTAESEANEPYIKGDSRPLPIVGAGQLLVGMIQSGFRINAILDALESKNEATLLSAPKITVENNKQAKISTVRKTYYETTTIQEQPNSAPIVSKTYNEIDLPIELIVLPKITDSDQINMNVNIMVSKILSATTGTGPPDTSSQSANTMVTGKNNETIVIGGLISERLVNQEEKIPVLGDIPILGMLFRGTKQSKDSVELVVFLTPSIIED